MLDSMIFETLRLDLFFFDCVLTCNGESYDNVSFWSLGMSCWMNFAIRYADANNMYVYID